ncbi:uncharacterized protein LOC134695847 isoform X1 [Mytilus trossulus]|uniref:uncharacterized protein LOC134695847 isoform X1 n=1 Tax=Mytilus trossulus TaxID=6551 RepID=UPI0030050DD5
MAANLEQVKNNVSYIVSNIRQSQTCPIEKEIFLRNSIDAINLILDGLLSLMKFKTVDAVIKEIPDTGQILGRLYVSKTIRGCSALYDKTTQCIMGLWRENPQTHIERKAAEWALAQVKSTVSVPLNSYFTVCQLGIQPKNVVKENNKQIVIQIKGKLREKFQEKMDQIKSKLDIEDTLESDSWFIMVYKQLLTVPINSPLLSLWDFVLEVLTLYPLEDPVSKKICEDLSKSLQHKKGYRHNITAATCYKLWTYSRPSLEQEVLFRIELCKDHVLTSEMDNIWNDSSLIKVCMLDGQIYEVIYKMVITLTGNTNLTILESFLRCVWREKRKCNSQDSLFLSMIYPAHSGVLINSLSVHPEDVKPENVGPHVKTLCDIFKEVIESYGETTELLVLSLQFKQWYQKALQLCFTCDRQFQTSCLDLVACYSSLWYKVQHQSIKDVLTRIVLCLRPLLVKSTLCYTDIMCVLSGNQVSNQGQMKDTIYHILLMFLYQGSGGLNVLTQVLKLITCSDSVSDHLTCLVVSHDQLFIDYMKWTIYKKRQYKDILNELMEQSSIIHPDIMDSVKDFLEKI